MSEAEATDCAVCLQEIAHGEQEFNCFFRCSARFCQRCLDECLNRGTDKNKCPHCRQQPWILHGAVTDADLDTLVKSIMRVRRKEADKIACDYLKTLAEREEARPNLSEAIPRNEVLQLISTKTTEEHTKAIETFLAKLKCYSKPTTFDTFAREIRARVVRPPLQAKMVETYDLYWRKFRRARIEVILSQYHNLAWKSVNKVVRHYVKSLVDDLVKLHRADPAGFEPGLSVGELRNFWVKHAIAHDKPRILELLSQVPVVVRDSDGDNVDFMLGKLAEQKRIDWRPDWVNRRVRLLLSRVDSVSSRTRSRVRMREESLGPVSSRTRSRVPMSEESLGPVS